MIEELPEEEILEEPIEEMPRRGAVIEEEIIEEDPDRILQADHDEAEPRPRPAQRDQESRF